MLTIDTQKCSEESTGFWTYPPGTVLTRDLNPPRRVVGITPIDGAQLWTNIAEHGWFEAKGPETPPDW